MRFIAVFLSGAWHGDDPIATDAFLLFFVSLL